MTNSPISGIGEEIGLTHASWQPGVVELECLRFLHERGNLASGSSVVERLRRISDSRLGAKNVRAAYVIMRVLRGIEGQEGVEIDWSESGDPRPYVVRLTPKGYAAIAGHQCQATMCYPPVASAEGGGVKSLTYGGAELYFVASLHECGNFFDPRSLRRTFDYLKVQGYGVRSQFVHSVESLGWVEVERAPTQPRPTLVSVRLSPRGFQQLRGHQCGANCTPLQI